MGDMPSPRSTLLTSFQLVVSYLISLPTTAITRCQSPAVSATRSSNGQQCDCLHLLGLHCACTLQSDTNEWESDKGMFLCSVYYRAYQADRHSRVSCLYTAQGKNH